MGQGQGKPGERVLTLGEQRVRLSFDNPDGDARIIKKIKRLAADFIDTCEELKRETAWPDGKWTNGPGIPVEVIRVLALAQTEAENASMWAVKAVTS
jgi:hypothetical protein